jgi:Di-haem oxidoreductase, putative peroxidase
MRHPTQHCRKIAMNRNRLAIAVVSVIVVMSTCRSAPAQLVDRTKAPNVANEGIAKTLAQQIGADRGDWYTPDSSSFVISRDPFRAIRRGRQLFQRKFSLVEGQGSLANDGRGDIGANLAIGAGMADSCAACHSRPRGSAGAGGAVATRPDSRDAPHLFGLGLKEMIADEITTDLRELRAQAVAASRASTAGVTVPLVSKGIAYGTLTVSPTGIVDTSKVRGVDADLRVRPFFAHGGKFSIREFVVGALNDEMGLQVVDAELASAKAGGRMVTQSGMVLDGTLDRLEGAPATNGDEDPDQDGIVDEIPRSLVDYLEFYLLNYFKPATYKSTPSVQRGRELFQRIDCTGCHVPDIAIRRDRRVADVDTVYDTERGLFNNLYATAVPLFAVTDDGTVFPQLKQPKLEPFVVKNIFADFKRHDLGANFHERNYDGSMQREFMTTPLWGVSTTAPYGHDGRSINLVEVILRHGGEAQRSRDAFAKLADAQQGAILDFLNSLVLFPPDDTASNLNPGDRRTAGFPQYGHGSIRLPALFNDPADPE